MTMGILLTVFGLFPILAGFMGAANVASDPEPEIWQFAICFAVFASGLLSVAQGMIMLGAFG